MVMSVPLGDHPGTSSDRNVVFSVGHQTPPSPTTTRQDGERRRAVKMVLAWPGLVVGGQCSPELLYIERRDESEDSYHPVSMKTAAILLGRDVVSDATTGGGLTEYNDDEEEEEEDYDDNHHQGMGCHRSALCLQREVDKKSFLLPHRLICQDRI